MASPAAKDSASVSNGIVEARGLAPKAPPQKRQLEWFYDEEDAYWDDYIGDFDTGVSDNSAKRRGLTLADSKDKRQFEWLYDDEDYYEDYIGDFDTGVTDSSAKAKAKRQTLTS